MEAGIQVTMPTELQLKWFLALINLASIFANIFSEVSKLLKIQTYHAIASKRFTRGGEVTAGS